MANQFSVQANELNAYHNFVAGEEDQRTNNEHAFYTISSGKTALQAGYYDPYPTHTNPVAGKLQEEPVHHITDSRFRFKIEKEM